MSGWQVGLAAACTGLAVFLAGAPYRWPGPHRSGPASGRGGAASTGPPGPVRDLVGVLRPVEGAPGVAARLSIGVITGCVLLLATGGPGWPGLVAGAVAGAGAMVAAGRYRPSGLRAAEVALAADVPSVCTLLAVTLEAGLPLRNAVAAVGSSLGGPAGEALRRLDAAVGLGQPEPDAWRELGDRHPALAGLAGELRHAVGNGVALAPVLRRHAREAQAERHAAAQARARRAGVTTVLPLVACFLPAFLLVGVVPIVGGVLGRLFG